MKIGPLTTIERRPAGAKVLTPVLAKAEIDELTIGESMVWYCGYLPIDRLYPRRPEAGLTREHWLERYSRERAVETLARFMLRQGTPARFAYSPADPSCAVQGHARGHLSQRRLGPMFYEYVFTKGASQ